jgi:hypothetical protein
MDDDFRQPTSDEDELEAHIAEFQDWFMQRQREHGMEGGPLISIEHAILRSYITWLRNHADQDL